MSSISKLYRFLSGKIKFIGSKFSIDPCVPETKKMVEEDNSLYWKKLAFDLSGYNRYGLYTHDLVNTRLPIVIEALHRLPEEMIDARNFRIIRAVQLDILKARLPKEKWITYEQDLAYRYLEPYILEIEKERVEMCEFDDIDYFKLNWPDRGLK